MRSANKRDSVLILCLSISQTLNFYCSYVNFLLIGAFGLALPFFQFLSCLGCNFGLKLLPKFSDQNENQDMSLCFYSW